MIVPGRVYRYEIALGPVGVRVRTGERLRVDVASADFPQWDRNLGSGGEIGREPAIAAVVATQVVLHDAEHPSSITCTCSTPDPRTRGRRSSCSIPLVTVYSRAGS